MNPSPSRIRLLPAPSENFGLLRFLGLTALALPLSELFVRQVVFPEPAGPGGAVVFATPFLHTMAALLGVGAASLGTVVWNRRARARRAGRDAAGLWWAARPFVFAFAALATAVGLFHAVENWRGARAWAAVQARLKARGEPLDLEALIPAPVPDVENFAATPLFRAAHTLVPRTSENFTTPFGGSSYVQDDSPAAAAARQRLGRLVLPAPIGSRTNKPGPRTNKADAGAQTLGSLPNGRLDLGQHLAGLVASTNTPKFTPTGSTAGDVLAALEPLSADLAEIAAAARRPKARFDTHPEDLYAALLPSMAPMKGLSQTFMLRSTARLAVGNRDGAFEDLQTASRLGETLREEHYIIGQLVRFAVHSRALRAFVEGLADHAWTEEQLRDYQALQAGLDFRQGLVGALRMERAVSERTIELAKLQRANVLQFENLFGDEEGSGRMSGPAVSILFYFGPAGWFDQNRAHVASYLDSMAETVQASPRRALDGAGAFDPLSRIQAESRAVDVYYFSRIAPAVGKVLSRLNEAEARHGMAVVACALERHWRKHGGYPATLDALVPTFLPRLPADLQHPGDAGASFTYRRTDDGGYALYSWGENRKDDQGVYRKGTDATDLDWVWPSPVGEGKRWF